MNDITILKQEDKTLNLDTSKLNQKEHKELLILLNKIGKTSVEDNKKVEINTEKAKIWVKDLLCFYEIDTCSFDEDELYIEMYTSYDENEVESDIKNFIDKIKDIILNHNDKNLYMTFDEDEDSEENKVTIQIQFISNDLENMFDKIINEEKKSGDFMSNIIMDLTIDEIFNVQPFTSTMTKEEITLHTNILENFEEDKHLEQIIDNVQNYITPHYPNVVTIDTNNKNDMIFIFSK